MTSEGVQRPRLPLTEVFVQPSELPNQKDVQNLLYTKAMRSCCSCSYEMSYNLRSTQIHYGGGEGSAVPLARHQLGAARTMQLVAAHSDMWTGELKGFPPRIRGKTVV